MLLCLLFFILCVMFILRFSHLIFTLVILEFISLVVLWSLVHCGVFLASSLVFFVVFCVFVLESVVAMVGFLNFLNFFGSDYVKGASVTA